MQRTTSITDKELQCFPIVEFDYPYSETGEMKTRYVRVTTADQRYIKGYELVTPISKAEGEPKTFARTRMARNSVFLISF